MESILIAWHPGITGSNRARIGRSNVDRIIRPHRVSCAGTNKTANAGDVLGKQPIEIVISIIRDSAHSALRVIIRVHLAAQPHLLSVVQATDALGTDFGFGQGRQKHSCQNSNNGNNHQQFNQRKPTETVIASRFAFVSKIHLNQILIT
jgi:hypothetical protein